MASSAGPGCGGVHRRYLRGYRGRVQRAIERLAGVEKLTLLSARDLVDPAALPAWVQVRFYDESLLLPAAPLTERNQRLAADWWPKGPEAPELEYRGVRLPALLTQVRGVEISGWRSPSRCRSSSASSGRRIPTASCS